MRLTFVKRLLVGPPMRRAQARHERLGKAVALAVFASDPLSSVAYATEEILLVLILAGSAALSYSLPVALGIAALLAIVVISYRQTVVAYQQGGGAYLVAKDNLGIFPALTAAAALLVDYVLTVSVSVVAGVAALTSAVPRLYPYRVVLSVFAVALIALGNLRGVRESGRLFAAPTYFFIVSAYLAYDFGIAPGGDETVVSKIARRVFGTGVPYYCVQSATLLILVLAANTSYADFPRLSSILARDRFVPRQFANQGDRLVFSNGILILSGFAILPIVAFAGDTHALLSLYAIGVFISFTLSQSGMVRRWLRLREKGWRWRGWVNGGGAGVTGVGLLTPAGTKFGEGAWIVVIVIPLLVGVFIAMRRHYDEVAAELSLEGLEGPPEFQHTVLVPIGDVHRGVVRAVQYAKTLAPTATVR